jgi:hypothetical protein
MKFIRISQGEYEDTSNYIFYSQNEINKEAVRSIVRCVAFKTERMFFVAIPISGSIARASENGRFTFGELFLDNLKKEFANYGIVEIKMEDTISIDVGDDCNIPYFRYTWNECEKKIVQTTEEPEKY